MVSESKDAKNLIEKSSSTVLEPLFVYGVKPEVNGGVFFSSDGASVVYPAGCGVAVYNVKV